MSDAGGPRRGLIVDWGGVMTTSPFASFAAFCEREGLDPGALGRRLLEDQEARALVVGLETGEFSEPDFEAQFAGRLGVKPDGLIDRLFAHYHPDEAMREVVRAARAAGIRTGLLSNSWGTRRYPRDVLAELFDGVVLSGEAGMRKPTPAIYELAAARVGLAPAECVFVDDLPRNLGPAEELGMATVHHVDAARTAEELERLLAIPLRSAARR